MNRKLIAAVDPARDQLVAFFKLEQAGQASLTLFDLNGRSAIRRPLGGLAAGESSATMPLQGMASGIYFLVLSVDHGNGTSERQTFKLALLK
jgi:hypothetical protein